MNGHPRPHPPLRRSLVLMAGGFAVLSAAAALVLALATTRMHNEAVELIAAVDSVRAAYELDRNLRIHARRTELLADTGDAIHTTRRDAAREAMAVWLGLIRDQPVGSRQAEATREFVDRIEAYLRAWSDPVAATAGPEVKRQRYRALEAALDGTAGLVTASLESARSAERDVRRLEDLSNGTAGLVGVLLLAAVGLLVLWARRAIYRPLAAIRDAAVRFGEGTRGARAPVVGPAEMAQVAEAFNAAADRIEVDRARRITFVAGIAHDLRTPLQALDLASGALAGDGPLPPEAQVRSMLAVVARQTSRLERMVGDLLDVARSETDRLQLHLEVIDVRALVRQVVALFEPTAPGMRFVTRLPEEPVTVRADAGRLDQVLVNLMSNAVKYSPGGSEVAIRAATKGTEVCLEVADRGLGLTPEEQTSLFEPFQRVDRISGIPGVGLGLWISRRIVEAHGGRLDIESRAGEGSTFRVWLPRWDGGALTPRG